MASFDGDRHDISFPERKDRIFQRDDNRLYTSFSSALTEIEACHYPSEAMKAIRTREVLTRFVSLRMNPVEAMPWLGERINKPRLNDRPCKWDLLPPEYSQVQNPCDQYADVALVPYAPSMDYLEGQFDKLYSPQSDLDWTALNILRDYGFYRLKGMQQHDLAYRDAFDNQRMHIPESTFHATWAKDTAYDGVDVCRSITHQDSVSRMFQTAEIIPQDTLVDYSNPDNLKMRFPMPMDLTRAVRQANSLLEDLHEEIGSNIDNNYHTIRDYDKRALQLFLGFRNAIDGCRWHLEHSSTQDEATKEMLRQTLQEAYLGFNTVLQTCNSRNDDGERFTTFHDMTTLIAGIKVDTPHEGGRHGDRAVHEGTVDYLDAFIAVGQYVHVADTYAKTVMNRMRPKWTAHEGGRALFGDFRTSHDTLRQQLMTMSVMYLRMPKWQQETYAKLIEDQFAGMEMLLDEGNGENNVDATRQEPILFIPSGTSARNGDHSIAGWDFSDIQQVNAVQHIAPLRLWALTHNNPKFQRFDGKIQVRADNGVADQGFEGLGSSGAYVDAYGYVHPGGEKVSIESKQEFDLELPPVLNEQVETLLAPEPEKTWIEKLYDAPTLLVESRLNTEAVAAVEQLLDVNPETGGTRTVARFAAATERLLGRKPTKDEKDFISLLQELSMLNNTQMGMDASSPEQLAELLEQMRTGKAELGDLDEGSLLIMMMATTGSIPRELIVELVLKNFKTLESALTLELVNNLEILDAKRLEILYHEKSEDHPILDARNKLREFLDAKKDIADYDPQSDPDFRDLATSTIEQMTLLLNNNREYDFTMRSSLIAVLAAKEQGQFVARCAVDGITLLTILKFVSPELCTYNAETYGPEELLPLQDWYSALPEAEESGGHSHSLTQTNLLNADGLTTIVAADATAGSMFVVDSDHATPLVQKNRVMKYGQATLQHSSHIYGGRRQVIGNCVTGGSQAMADLAIDVGGGVEYALLANPDWVELHRQIAVDPKMDVNRRTQSLDLLLILQPHRLTMTPKGDYLCASTAQNLRSIVELCRTTNRWGGALFAANILQKAGYFTQEISGDAQTLYNLVVREIAMLPEKELGQTLLQQRRHLVRNDVAAIRLAREAFLAEVEARKQATADANLEKLMEEVRAEAMIAITIDHENTDRNLVAAEFTFGEQEREAALVKENESPAFGSTATHQYREEMSERAVQIIVDTVADASPDLPIINPLLFETTNEATQDKALSTYLLGDDGTQVDAELTARRLAQLQLTITRIALAITVKKKTKELRASGSDQTSLILNDAEELVVELAQALHGGLEKTAGRLNLSLPVYNPRLSPVVANNSELLALNG